jgi:hypothetical protein
MGSVLWFYCETWLIVLGGGYALVGLLYLAERQITKWLDKRNGE